MTHPLPASGGSYTREADGALSPVPHEPAPNEDRPGPAPVKPAVKRPVKEA